MTEGVLGTCLQGCGQDIEVAAAAHLMQMTKMIVGQDKLAQTLQNHHHRHPPDHPVPWHPLEDDLL